MRKKNIVTIGGGTGSFTLLSGLKKYPFNISAIVSMADDGGSTGRLRDELGVLPPGDVRQCLVALSEESETLRNLFNYRFESGQLKGHSLGNLFLSALEKMTGNFSKGLGEAMKVLKIQGKVIPVTNDNVNLHLELNNGKVLKGEDEVNHNFEIQKLGIKKLFLSPGAKANPSATSAIKRADVIIIGPGNHYCSVIPNLLIKEISLAIMNSKAKVVYVANLVNKKGHTERYNLADYVHSINKFIGGKRIDYVIFNNRLPSMQIRLKYKKRGDELISKGDFKDMDCRVIAADVINREIVKYSKADKLVSQRSLIRHDGEKIAKIILSIFKPTIG
jgi:uncharacterized cofD-like protein